MVKELDNNKRAELWEKTEMTFAAFAARQHIPLGGTFELTARCNLKCKMCFIRLDKSQVDEIGKELDAKQWISLAKEAVASGTLNLLITGGEPIIRPDFEEIYTVLANMGFVLTLNTNATLMSPDLKKLFMKYPPTATNVTLYGASADTYEKICGNRNGFDQTIRGLDMLAEVPTNLEIRTTFIKDNMNELVEVRQIANNYTKRFGMNVVVNKPIRGAISDAENCRLTPAQMCDVSEANSRYYLGLNGTNNSSNDIDNDKNANVIEKDLGFDIPPQIISCLASKSLYYITWDGKMLPCGSFSCPYTLPLVEGFKNAWDRLPTLFEDLKLPHECNNCEHNNGSCSNCPAILQMESGELDKISLYNCGVAKERARRKSKRK